MDGVSKTLIYPSAPTVTALLEVRRREKMISRRRSKVDIYIERDLYGTLGGI